MKTIVSLFFLLTELAVFGQNEPAPVFLESLDQLDGRYEIVSTDSSYVTLEELFFMSDKVPRKGYLPEKAFVEIKTDGEGTARATLFIGGEQQKTARLKLKMANGRAHFRKKKFRLFTLVLNIYNSTTAKLAPLDNGDLLFFDVNRGGCGMVVFFPLACAGDETARIVFSKIR